SHSPILCSSSPPSSDLGEVMLIDLPCSSSISNSNPNSISNSYSNSDPNSNSTSIINQSKYQSLPCQVDALTYNEHLTSMSNSVLHPVSYPNSKLSMVDVSMNESLPCQNDTSRTTEIHDCFSPVVGRKSFNFSETFRENSFLLNSCGPKGSAFTNDSLTFVYPTKISKGPNSSNTSLITSFNDISRPAYRKNSLLNVSCSSNNFSLEVTSSKLEHPSSKMATLSNPSITIGSKSVNKLKIPPFLFSSCPSTLIPGDIKNAGLELQEVSCSLNSKLIHIEPKLKDGKVLLQSSLNHDNQNKWLSQFPFELNMTGKGNKMNFEQIHLLKHKKYSMQTERDGNGYHISSGGDIAGEKVSGNEIQDNSFNSKSEKENTSKNFIIDNHSCPPDPSSNLMKKDNRITASRQLHEKHEKHFHTPDGMQSDIQTILISSPKQEPTSILETSVQTRMICSHQQGEHPINTTVKPKLKMNEYLPINAEDCSQNFYSENSLLSNTSSNSRFKNAFQLSLPSGNSPKTTSLKVSPKDTSISNVPSKARTSSPNGNGRNLSKAILSAKREAKSPTT
ncbi:hypothetical protein ROZALSC1DRAFT_25304, partial [Rozella allomycis CSF55]